MEKEGEKMNIEEFCKKYNFGKVYNISKLSGGLMHKMFKVETEKGTYCIKVLNPEVMNRDTAYNNFVVSERISNLAKDNNIPVSNALNINNNFINKHNDNYYMIFDYVEGKVLKDNEITTEHCKKIGNILAHIHLLDYTKLNIESDIKKRNTLYDWESYIKNFNFNTMIYKDLYLANYKKYNSLLKRCNERYNSSNKNLSICHNDMDTKNVMWNNDEPIIIDWECASISNPERELLEEALCWSGFLSNNFDKDKFTTIFTEYSKYRSIDDIEWYDVICGNLIGRFNWLKYNLDRSLGIITNDTEEIELSTNEVVKTIDEINRYIDLVGTMYKIIDNLITTKENYDKYMDKLVETNELLKNKSYNSIADGFTNTIYSLDNYIVRLCTKEKNEEKFKNEIEFYNKNKENSYIPKLYYNDTTKSIIPYYYEIIEKLEGQTLYDIWYKIDDNKRKELILKIIEVVKSYHFIKTEEYDFAKYIKDKIQDLLNKTELTEFDNILDLCDIYFKENDFRLIHGDLHFDNFIYDGNNLKLIDFEYCMNAPIDYDFRIFSLYKYYPYLHAGLDTDMKTVESDYQDLMNIIVDNYDELKDIKYLKERLTIYQLIELLNNYKNTKDEEKLDMIKEKVMGLK